MRTTRVLVVLAVVVLLGPAVRSSGPRHERRFDDRLLAREGGIIAVEPRAIEDLDPTDPVRRGWSAFGKSHGGNLRVYLDDRSGMPTLVSGAGIELFPAAGFEERTLSEVAAAIRKFLAAHGDLPGDWSGRFELDDEASDRLREGHWQIVFRQSQDGVRVENARLDFHIDRGRLTLFGASNWSPPTVSGIPSIDAEDARDFLDAHLGVAVSEYIEVAEPTLVMMALDAAPALDGPRRRTG